MGAAGIGEGYFLVVNQDPPFVGLVIAGQNLEQRRLTRPILPDKGQDFARPDFKRDIVKGLNVGEGFADVVHLDRINLACRLGRDRVCLNHIHTFCVHKRR